MSYGGSCIGVDKLDPSVFNDVCVATNNFNETSWKMTQDAFKTCGGPKNFFVTDDDCDIYSNITTPFDTVMFGNCLADSMAANFDWSQMDWDCYPLGWGESSSVDTKPGVIATTWSYPDSTETVTHDNGVVTTETQDYWGSIRTAVLTTSGKASPTATGSTATKTTGSVGSKSSGSTATPTSSPKPSRAGPRMRVSYETGALFVLSVLGLML
ncbi:hypothetical protein N431DRAFT_430439 [Stipitochalara longipes BDJ]|nr:hypothetical protein N431DRAFT_430439 [Stipitochalara longipes BDJ]